VEIFTNTGRVPAVCANFFNVALDNFHYWRVIDLVKISDDFDEYILLVTDSDTGNFARVWKLLKDGTPIGNFISTEVTRD